MESEGFHSPFFSSSSLTLAHPSTIATALGLPSPSRAPSGANAGAEVGPGASRVRLAPRRLTVADTVTRDTDDGSQAQATPIESHSESALGAGRLHLKSAAGARIGSEGSPQKP